MSRKERIKTMLGVSRKTTEDMLADMKTPQDWTYQVSPQANHALWVAGHLATTDNFFVKMLAPEKAIDLAGFQEKFGFKSQPVPDPAAYPPPEEVLSRMRERRATLMAAIEKLTDADLENPIPPGSPPFMTDVGSGFEFMVWHEGLHTGQLSIARRSLGFAPLFNPPEK